jgi:hypothetical protein
MIKSPDGVWRLTLPPVVPGFHYYWFILDGVAVSDPASKTYFGYGKEVSGLEVPDPQGDFYAVKAVPHGVARSSTHRRDMTRTRDSATHSSSCNMATVRMRRAGRAKARRNSSSTT